MNDKKYVQYSKEHVKYKKIYCSWVTQDTKIFYVVTQPDYIIFFVDYTYIMTFAHVVEDGSTIQENS